ncbi:uncharacterized protein STEHIDRAFT_122222 [Stereum hirsutum FP-91666 SS1]|uniref:uncharacterized protein n=1 Tax=Stereum hirsutum (strain FP-91666) TaxID=721885 RepID=UPI00044494F9|nr:uncharacterized protein STEHIDRAFT_122222 [Stereum hirsutum FP-91666 SS1]EIM86301.1 hypothetical protein STEHIDRAFT_122222 [Stereum hirsutum FP-91666 SS1]
MSIRVMCLMKRKEGMSKEEFSEYWSNNHGKLFSSVKSVQTNLVRYSQFHILSKESETVAALGLPIGPYDGAAEFYVNDLKDLLAVFGGEEYQQNVVPDELKFMKRDEVMFLVGENDIKFEK